MAASVTACTTAFRAARGHTGPSCSREPADLAAQAVHHLLAADAVGLVLVQVGEQVPAHSSGWGCGFCFRQRWCQEEQSENFEWQILGPPTEQLPSTEQNCRHAMERHGRPGELLHPALLSLLAAVLWVALHARAAKQVHLWLPAVMSSAA